VTDQPHPGHHLAVVHAGRADHPDRAADAIGHLVGGQHQAALAQAAAGVLAPDDDLDVLLERDLLQDGSQFGALLEQLHELLQPADLDELWVTKEVAHAIMQDYRVSLGLVGCDRLDQPLDDAALLGLVRPKLT